MEKRQKQVADFMRAAGQKLPDGPAVPDRRTRMLRVKLLLEEVLELAEASGVEVFLEDAYTGQRFVPSAGVKWAFRDVPDAELDIVGTADAVADINYVSNGTAVAWGVDMEEVEDEVHRTNMAKFRGGKRREDGKWQKPKNWEPPDIEAIIKKQMGDGRDEKAS